jgi:hypothetical protein
VLRRIATKLRARLKPESVEKLTIGYHYMKAEAKHLASEFAASLGLSNADNIDLADLQKMIGELVR